MPSKQQPQDHRPKVQKPHKAKKVQDPNLKPTSAAQWKSKREAGTDVEMPSGNIAKLRRVALPSLLADNVFPDSMAGYVQKALDNASKGLDTKEVMSDDELKGLVADPKKVKDMFAVFDKICLMVVIEPHLLPVPAVEAERDPTTLYVDEVDLEDKMFIFQYAVGGDPDLDRFRAETQSAMGGLGTVPGIQITP